MEAGEVDRGSSSGGRQEYLDNVSVLVTGVYLKCPRCTTAGSGLLYCSIRLTISCFAAHSPVLMDTDY